MKIKYIKSEPGAFNPQFSDSRITLFGLTEQVSITPNGPLFSYRTGIKLIIPDGYMGIILPPDDITEQSNLIFQNGVKSINSNVEVVVDYKNLSQHASRLKTGSKVADIIIIPKYELYGEEER